MLSAKRNYCRRGPDRELYIFLKNHANRCEQANLMYLPKDPIKLLVIGESPPATGTYFYMPRKLRAKEKSIPGQVFRALLDVDIAIGEEAYSHCLERLKQDLRFYLTDLSPIPVNCFTAKFRIDFIKESFKSFVQKYRLLKLSKGAHKILVLPVNTINELHKARNRSFFESLLNDLEISPKEICRFSHLEGELVAIAENIDSIS